MFPRIDTSKQPDAVLVNWNNAMPDIVYCIKDNYILISWHNY